MRFFGNNSALVLESGDVFPGHAPAWFTQTVEGEAVFTTGMTGYPETLTDPSYTDQIIVFTYPLIGNYGIPPQEKWESTKIHAKGVVVSESCRRWSHAQGQQSLLEWLEKEKVPIVAGVDTRSVTKALRASGTMRAALTPAGTKEICFSNQTTKHLVRQAVEHKVSIYGSGNKVVIAVDCGMKENIIRSLMKFPITIKRVPFDYDFTKENYDGVFLSNGPGDPVACWETLPYLTEALKGKKPVFGICLGLQLMALAAGAKTFKLPFGHRGQNQPCIEVDTQKCFITSQNHGYAVREESLPGNWKMTFKNLNDGTVEGIAHKTRPFFAVQFHPEASPGPTDTQWLFQKFYDML